MFDDVSIYVRRYIDQEPSVRYIGPESCHVNAIWHMGVRNLYIFRVEQGNLTAVPSLTLEHDMFDSLKLELI